MRIDNSQHSILNRIHSLEREIEELKRDLLLHITVPKKENKRKPSHFGTVHSDDISEEMIEASKKSIFRSFLDS